MKKDSGCEFGQRAKLWLDKSVYNRNQAQPKRKAQVQSQENENASNPNPKLQNKKDQQSLTKQSGT